MIILFSGSRSPNISYDYTIAEDYSSFLLNTKIQDVQNDYIDNLTIWNITNPNNRIMEQLDIFYFNGNAENDTIAQEMLSTLTDSVVSKKYGVSYGIYESGGSGRVLYSRTTPDINNARVIVVSRKITLFK